MMNRPGPTCQWLGVEAKKQLGNAGLTRTRDLRRLVSGSKIVLHGRTRGAAGVGGQSFPAGLRVRAAQGFPFLSGIKLVQLLVVVGRPPSSIYNYNSALFSFEFFYFIIVFFIFI